MRTNLPTFGVRIDPARSRGAYLYDLGTNIEWLDLTGLYASLPLGYDDPALRSPEFASDMAARAAVKVPLGAVATTEVDSLLDEMNGWPWAAAYEYVHFACTGALAIEAAIKAALDAAAVSRASRRTADHAAHARTSHAHRARLSTARVVMFERSFHGINGYGGLLSDRNGPAKNRLAGLLHEAFGSPLPLPAKGEDYAFHLACVERELEMGAAAVLIEPVRCAAGDLETAPGFLRALGPLCARYGCPLIFDEVQTGFGSTGSFWAWEHYGCMPPDLVVFGKKAQVSGVLVSAPYAHVFARPERLQVTWDGDAMDAVRSRAILRAYRERGLVEHGRTAGKRWGEVLRAWDVPHRRVGLLCCVDCSDVDERDQLVRALRERHVLTLPTGDTHVRMRLPLTADVCTVLDAAYQVGSALSAVRRGSVEARPQEVPA